MPKKPSEWDRETIWRESAEAHAKVWDREGGMTSLRVLPFPPDPPERVSDQCVQWWAGHEDESVRRMALELIERRAKDKEQGR